MGPYADPDRRPDHLELNLRVRQEAWPFVVIRQAPLGDLAGRMPRAVRRGRESALHESAAARSPRLFVSDVEVVAREGFEASIAGRAIAVPGRANRRAASVVLLYLRWLVRTVGGLIGRRPA